MAGSDMNLTESRREFFKSSGRMFLLGGLAAIAAVAVRRGRDCAAPACDRPVVCQGCSLFSSCTLPKAHNARSEPGGLL